MSRVATDTGASTKAGAAFIQYAGPLAAWTSARIIVREDVYGAYKLDGGQYTAHEALTLDLLQRHYRGETIIGAHSTSPDGRCKTVALDIDAHSEKDDPEANWRCALRAVELFADLGLEALIFDSNGAGGYHVRAFFKRPIASTAAYWLCGRIKAILATEGFPAIESFPKQAAITLDCPFGNWLRLPGRHHKRPHWTRVYDLAKKRWLDELATVKRLIAVSGDKPDRLLKAYQDEQQAKESPDDPWKMTVGQGGSTRHQGSVGRPSAEEVRSALNAVPAEMLDRYDAWLGVGMALHHWGDPAGLDLWKEASSRCREKYSASVCDDKYSTFSGGGASAVTIRTIFRAAYDNGWQGWAPPKQEKAKTSTGGQKTGQGVGPEHSKNGNGKHQDETGSGSEPDEEDAYATATDAELGIIDASEIEEENPEWLWEDRFLYGKINLIAGEGGDGKTTIAIAVAATKTRGGKFADGKPSGEPGNVAILAAEDGAGDTLKPRFVAAGGDLSPGRLKVLQARVTIPKTKDRPALIHPVNLQDIPYWRAIFVRLKLSVLIIDPLPAYLGRGVNDHKNADVQALLNQFAALASEFRVCIIAVTHTGKAKDLKMVHRVLGSVAYTNCARVVHVTVRDPDDENARYLARPKCNLDEPRDPLAYKLVSAEYRRGENTFKTSRVEFEAEPVKVDLEAMGNGKPARGPDAKKTMALAAWLHDLLIGRPGPTPLGAIFDEAGKADLIGKRREDGKWSSVALLYQARDRVPLLPQPQNGKRVDDLKAPINAGGRNVTHWYLVDADAAY